MSISMCHCHGKNNCIGESEWRLVSWGFWNDGTETVQGQQGARESLQGSHIQEAEQAVEQMKARQSKAVI